MPQIITAFLGVAHIHTPSFIQTLNARAADIAVRYVYDHDTPRGLQRAAELPGALFVSDPNTIYDDPQVGSVVVCSETNRHPPLVTAAARAGKHIFCEKPLGLGESDTRVMAEAIRSAGVTFQTGFNQRGAPLSQFIRREVMAGHLGKITRARFSNGHQAALEGWFDTNWRWLTDTAQAGGGAFLDMGAHVLDIALHLLSSTEGSVTGVSCALGNRGGRYGHDIDEYGTGLLTFASGATTVLEASWVDPFLRSPTEVFGTEGQIQEQSDGTVLYASAHVEGADGKRAVQDLPPAAPLAFDLFWDSLLGRELPVPLVTVDEAAQESIWMERLYHAAGRSTTTGL